MSQVACVLGERLHHDWSKLHTASSFLFVSGWSMSGSETQLWPRKSQGKGGGVAKFFLSNRCAKEVKGCFPLAPFSGQGVMLGL